MLNLDLNIETKEWILYAALGGVFTLIVWSVYAQSITLVSAGTCCESI